MLTRKAFNRSEMSSGRCAHFVGIEVSRTEHKSLQLRNLRTKYRTARRSSRSFRATLRGALQPDPRLVRSDRGEPLDCIGITLDEIDQ